MLMKRLFQGGGEESSVWTFLVYCGKSHSIGGEKNAARGGVSLEAAGCGQEPFVDLLTAGHDILLARPSPNNQTCLTSHE